MSLRRLWAKARSRAPRTQPGQFRMERSRIVRWGLMAAMGLIGARAVHLCLFASENDYLRQLAKSQYQKDVELAPYRGAILDRRGEALAISVRRPSLAINPRVFAPSEHEIARLSRILSIPERTIRQLKKRKTYFAWLARQLERRVADEAMRLSIDGMTLVTEPSRFYPAGVNAAQLIGFVGLDSTGLAGLERQFDAELRGEPQRILARRDARGQFIFDDAPAAQPDKMGRAMHLTIDKVIQEIAESELAQGMRKSRAPKGFAIVADPHTGKILAVANYPSFDPNSRGERTAASGINHALTDLFEPGSVTKPFIIARALDTNSVRLDEQQDCENGRLKVGKAIIHDTHRSGLISVTDTIVQSSNICTYKIAQKMGREAAWQALHDFGFAAGLTRLGFPGESKGRIAHWESWIPIRFANVAFGHGFVTTGLELVQAMSVIANGGNLIPPTLVERIVAEGGASLELPQPPPPRRVISPETARQVREILQKVVTDPHGTGKRAATKRYSTAGKTGTAQKVDPAIRAYAKDKYIAGFVGFAPVGDPHLVVYVQIDEPREKPYHGGVWAAPVFSAIVERSLRYLNVAPDLAPVESQLAKDKPVPEGSRAPGAMARPTPHAGSTIKL